MHHLHLNWSSQMSVEVADRSLHSHSTLMQIAGLLRIQGRVLDCRKKRFRLIFRLRIKQDFGASAPFTQDQQSGVDGNSRDP